MEEHNPQGSITIAPRAIATLAHHAAVQTYGVVGLASKSIVNGLTNFLVKDPTHGIDVHYEADEIQIDIYIVVEYGTRIKTVAASVANSVRFTVEKAIGMPVSAINVHVQGLRISDPNV